MASKTNMEWKQEEIRNDFYGIIRDSKNLSESSLEEKYVLFKEAFPKLYEMALESVASNSVQKTIGFFNMMMEKRQAQKEGVVSKNASDMMVGNQLAQKYIYPKTGTPSKADYKQAVDKIEKGNAMKELETKTETN